MAVRRLSSMTSLLNVKNRPSAAPSLATVPSSKEEEEEEEDSVDEGGKELVKKPGLNGNHVDQESVALRKCSVNFLVF